MTEEDIESLQKRALNQEEEKNLQDKYDKEHGSFESKEEYQKALENKDDATIKRIIFDYAKR
eukprot:4944062-Amphidinium_carterae.1